MVWKVVDVIQERFCDRLPDETLTACCFITKALNRKFSYYWFKRYGIIVSTVPYAQTTNFYFTNHKAFHVLPLCRLFPDYQPTSSLSCALSKDRDVAVLELNLLGRFIHLQTPWALMIRVRRDYLSDVASFFLQYRGCCEITISGEHIRAGGRGQPQHHFRSNSWNHITSFAACSPVLFDHQGRRLVVAIAHNHSLRELRLIDQSARGRMWGILLPQLAIPNLVVFEIDGKVSLNNVAVFLARHCKVANLTLGNSITSRRWRPAAIVLPCLQTLRAPARLAAPFVRVCPTLLFLFIRREEQLAEQDYRTIILSLVGAKVTTLIIDINEQCMTALDEPYVPTCLRHIHHITFQSREAFSLPMLVCVSPSLHLHPSK